MNGAEDSVVKTLDVLYEEHQGNVSDKWASYLPIYDNYLSKFRDSPISLLEIGVQNGGSLEIWAKYFPKAKRIVGCDIDERCAALSFRDPRVSIVVGDALEKNVRRRIEEVAGSLDVLIEDGSHKSNDIVKTFALYFPLIKDGGVFISEDLHASYWAAYDGGVYHPYSSLSFFKRLADVVNHEHWAIRADRQAILRTIGDEYGVQFEGAELERIHSVSFFNSVCVIQKEHPSRNLLGERIIAGDLAPVTSKEDILTRGADVGFAEEANPWSQITEAPETVIANLQHRLRDSESALIAAQLAATQAERRASFERQYNDGLKSSIEEMMLEVRALNVSLRDAERHRNESLARIREIESTKSWRYTRYLSRLKAFLSRRASN